MLLRSCCFRIALAFFAMLVCAHIETITEPRRKVPSCLFMRASFEKNLIRKVMTRSLGDAGATGKRPGRSHFYHRRVLLGKAFALGAHRPHVRKPSNYQDTGVSFFLTVSLTARPSAFLPARSGMTAFITAPISFTEAAPVSAIAAATALSISSCEAACGR